MWIEHFSLLLKADLTILVFIAIPMLGIACYGKKIRSLVFPIYRFFYPTFYPFNFCLHSQFQFSLELDRKDRRLFYGH